MLLHSKICLLCCAATSWATVIITNIRNFLQPINSEQLQISVFTSKPVFVIDTHIRDLNNPQMQCNIYWNKVCPKHTELCCHQTSHSGSMSSCGPFVASECRTMFFDHYINMHEAFFFFYFWIHWFYFSGIWFLSKICLFVFDEYFIYNTKIFSLFLLEHLIVIPHFCCELNPHL